MHTYISTYTHTDTDTETHTGGRYAPDADVKLARFAAALPLKAFIEARISVSVHSARHTRPGRGRIVDPQHAVSRTLAQKIHFREIVRQHHRNDQRIFPALRA